MSAPVTSLALEAITHRIFVLRDQRVLLDSDLAALYGVDTGRLNEQVRRNRERFPKDFIFELTREGFSNLKSQFATTSSTGPGHGGRRKLPLAFTEHGAIMTAAVLSRLPPAPAAPGRCVQRHRRRQRAHRRAFDRLALGQAGRGG